MAIIKITQADLLRSKLLDPGYYGSKIVAVSGLEPTADKQSFNLIVTFRLDSSGKEIKHYFNSKAFGMMAPLHKAVFGTEMVEGEFDADTLMDKKVDCKIFTDTFQGSLNNKIEGWVPYGGGKAASATPF